MSEHLLGYHLLTSPLLINGSRAKSRSGFVPAILARRMAIFAKVALAGCVATDVTFGQRAA